MSQPNLQLSDEHLLGELRNLEFSELRSVLAPLSRVRIEGLFRLCLAATELSKLRTNLGLVLDWINSGGGSLANRDADADPAYVPPAAGLIGDPAPGPLDDLATYIDAVRLDVTDEGLLANVSTMLTTYGSANLTAMVFALGFSTTIDRFIRACDGTEDDLREVAEVSAPIDEILNSAPSTDTASEQVSFINDLDVANPPVRVELIQALNDDQIATLMVTAGSMGLGDVV